MYSSRYLVILTSQRVSVICKVRHKTFRFKAIFVGNRFPMFLLIFYVFNSCQEGIFPLYIAKIQHFTSVINIYKHIQLVEWMASLVIYIIKPASLNFVTNIPRDCSQMYPVRTQQLWSFQRHPYPIQFKFHRTALNNEPHLPSPFGSFGPHKLNKFETFFPSDQIQRNLLLNPRNKSLSSSFISLLCLASNSSVSQLLTTARSAPNLWHVLRALPHIRVDWKSNK